MDVREFVVGFVGGFEAVGVGRRGFVVGTMTRLLRFLTALPKTYIGEVVLGSETTTLDDTGEVTATHEPEPATYGDPGTVEVSVGDDTATGTVTLTAGEKSLGTAEVVDGAAISEPPRVQF